MVCSKEHAETTGKFAHAIFIFFFYIRIIYLNIDLKDMWLFVVLEKVYIKTTLDKNMAIPVRINILCHVINLVLHTTLSLLLSYHIIFYISAL